MKLDMSTCKLSVSRESFFPKTHRGVKGIDDSTRKAEISQPGLPVHDSKSRWNRSLRVKSPPMSQDGWSNVHVEIITWICLFDAWKKFQKYSHTLWTQKA